MSEIIERFRKGDIKGILNNSQTPKSRLEALVVISAYALHGPSSMGELHLGGGDEVIIALVNSLRALEEWRIAESDTYRERLRAWILDGLQAAGDAQKRLNPEERALADLVMTLVYADIYEYHRAIRHGKSAASNKSAITGTVRPYAHFVLGRTYRAFEETAKALKVMEKARDGFLAQGNMPMTAMAALELGDMYVQRGDEVKAIGAYEEALRYLKTSRNSVARAHAMRNLGLLYVKSGRVLKGRRYITKALSGLKRSTEREERIMAKLDQLEADLILGRKGAVKRKLLALLRTDPVKQYRDCYNRLYALVHNVGWLKEDKDTGMLFANPHPRTIKASVLREALRLARESHPYEFGALLKGKDHIEALVFVPNTARGKRSVMFQLYYNPFGHERVEGDGVVHSHPSGSARPSGADLAMFSRFPGVNIIIAYPYTMDSWAAYDTIGNRIQLRVVED